MTKAQGSQLSVRQKRALFKLQEDTKPVEDISNLSENILKYVQSKHRFAMRNLDFRTALDEFTELVFSQGGLHSGGLSGPVTTPFAKVTPLSPTPLLTKQISSELF